MTRFSMVTKHPGICGDSSKLCSLFTRSVRSRGRGIEQTAQRDELPQHRLIMISRRDKLLVQPWEDRRYEDHRRKVQSAVAAVDTRAPPARPHVALKLKKLQRESERSSRIQSDNFSLLQRLGALMNTNRLDNHWTKPLPRFQRKVCQFSGAPAAPPPPPQRVDTPPGGKCFACAHLKGLAM